MSATNVRAGRAFVEIGGNDAQLQKLLGRVSARFKAWGASLAKLGVGLSAPLVAATKVYADFEQAMADLRAAANPTAEQFDRMKASILAISKAAGSSPMDVAAVFTELLKAGMSLESVMGGAAEATIKFARVGQLDAANAATVVNDALNVFAREGLNATQAVDTLSRAADASSISIEQIAQAFSMSAAVFGSAGLTMGDLAAAIGLLGNAGVKGSDAGTSLKTMLLRLQTGAESAGEVMKKYGINVRDAQGNMKPMAGIIAELQGKLGGLQGQARDQALLKLFGSDAIRAGQILLAQGTKGWADFQGKLGGSLSVSEKFAQQTDTFWGKLRRLWSTVERVAITIGETLKPYLDLATRAAGDAADAVERLAEKYGVVVAAVAGGAVALVAGGAALLALGLAAKVAAVGVGVLAAVVAAVTSPAGLLTAAVVGLAAAFLTLTEPGRQALGWLGDRFDELRTRATAAFGGIRDALAGGNWRLAVQIAWAAIQAEFWRGIAALEKAWGDFVGMLARVTAPLVGYFGTTWGQVWAGFKSLMGRLVDGAVVGFTAVQAVVINWRDSLKLALVAVELAVVKLWELWKYYATEIVPTTLGWLVANGPKILGGLWVEINNQLLRFLLKAWGHIKDIIPRILDWIWKTIKAGKSQGEAIADVIAGAMVRGYDQDVIGPDGSIRGPQFQQRQKSEAERRLEGELGEAGAGIGETFDRKLAENRAALDRVKEQIGGALGGLFDGPGAAERARQLQEEINALIAAAAAGRAGSGGGGGNAGAGAGGPGEDRKQPNGAAVAAALGKLSAVGTFNALAAGQLFGRSTFGERIAKATEETARNTRGKGRPVPVTDIDTTTFT